jgi:hypothetical protein
VDGYEGLERVTVAEAASKLGIKEQAVRKRISRGTLPHDKDEDGRVYVYVTPEPEDEVQGNSTGGDTYLDTLVESLQEQNRFLREELARKDAILMNMTQTMRQITAPSEDGREEAPESAEPRPGTPTPTEAGGGAQEAAEAPEGEPRRGFFSRLFGG